jgi:hypothetical protein
MLELGLPLPAYEQMLKSSHTFNLLDARRAISVTERQGYILRVRALARAVAEAYYRSREALGFPLADVAEQESKRCQAPPAATAATHPAAPAVPGTSGVAK